MKSVLFCNGKLIDVFKTPIFNLRLKSANATLRLNFEEISIQSHFFKNSPFNNNSFVFDPISLKYIFDYEKYNGLLNFKEFSIIINSRKYICIIEANNIYFVSTFENNKNNDFILKQFENIFYEHLCDLAKILHK
jgi:hypothetical protein